MLEFRLKLEIYFCANPNFQIDDEVYIERV